MVETKSIGICIGAATLSAVEVRRDENDGLTVEPVYVEPHQGNPREALRSVLARLGPNGGYKVAVTGRKLRHAVNLSSISEPEAVESALSYLNGKGRHYDAIISAGGETFLVYVLTEDGKISSIQTGNKCASGTGEFFLQQLRRIGLTPEDAVRGADIVVTSGPILQHPKPVVEMAWLKMGVFLSAVDLDSYIKPEVFNAAGKLYTDDVEQFMGYSRQGYFAGIREPIGDLGELVAGKKPARQSSDELTMTANLGLAIEDIAVAARIYRVAKTQGLGRELPL